MLVVESSWYLYALGEHLFCDKGSGLRPAMVNSEVHVGELQLPCQAVPLCLLQSSLQQLILFEVA